MNTTMETPDIILLNAKNLIESFGNHFIYLGEYKNNKVFQFQFPDGIDTGFPIIYTLSPDNNVVKVTGPETLDIIQKMQSNQSTIYNI